MEQQIHAADVAAYLVQESANEGYPITQLELQKLLAMCQSLYAHTHQGKPLFTDKVEAWDLGPAVRDVYRLYNQYGNKPIDHTMTTLHTLPDDVLQTIAEIITIAGRAGVNRLLDVTHNDVWRRYHHAHGSVEIPVSELAASWTDYETITPHLHDDLIENMPATQTFTQEQLEAATPFVQEAIRQAKRNPFRFEA